MSEKKDIVLTPGLAATCMGKLPRSVILKATTRLSRPNSLTSSQAGISQLFTAAV